MSNNQEEKQTTEGIKNLKRSYITDKIVIYILLILLGVALIGGFLNVVQARTALAKQQKNNELALSEVVSILDKNTESSNKLTEIYHQGNWKALDDIDRLLSSGLFDKLINDEVIVGSQVFTELSVPSGIPYLYLLDMNGRIVMSADETIHGMNPAASNIMTQENLNGIMAWCRDKEGNVAPVLVKNQFGTYYFYSKPFIHNDQQYALVIGASSWTLDNRIASLKDVSTVLSRMGVINNGFLFAIDKEDNLFSYFKNNDAFLTGQNAFAVGLNEQVMEDGYKGTQTIMGKKYYCSSRLLGENTVVVAAAKAIDVRSRDKYVMIWSVMGFFIVMSLCLAYAVIVRNDFIRQGIKTDRIKIFKKAERPLYFNRSVFSKVFPLMVIGLLVVYAISFYTQTLLEITEGVDKSKVILQEVTGRYEENQDSRSVIEDYYNSRFLSTARLITFYVEETPEVFNAGSDFYHSTYDENGHRQYLYDDEGNRLKSVANSAILQDLCDSNSIDAIYIFDENGHTIATNTPNWFFTLSHNKDDQSYPFRQVLEGKTDSYLQTAMTNDLGEEAQFFGIVLHYYTTTDASGNTVYVSRYAYEEACAAEGVSDVVTVRGITKHRSLLQIELDEELVESITGTTSSGYVLNTEMLDGGAVAIFDTSRDHVCVYSPVAASVGRTADELGVSSNAFTGLPYYGINRINGVSYFLYFRYISNYFFATAIPSSSMFTSRTAISAITAGVSLVMITILLLLVTVSSEEEEQVYDILSTEDADGNLNSSFFSIILPSGRSASTRQAATRWNNERVPWSEKSPEMKLGSIVGWAVGIPLLYLIISAVGINSISEDDSVIRYIISGNWDKGPNIFAFSACIMVITLTVIGIELFKIPVREGTVLLGTQGETIGHLILSVVRYGGVITAIFYCLYLLGIDSPNLLASAGILSLVIGFGAQSLIKDILAGIFIIFEGEFRVGDIVTINGFRGTVTDVGLRTTKISSSGNIKIFNNSEISGVLNMTKETSVASATIGVDYSQDIAYVEEVLNRELPLLKDANKDILSGPTYGGVSELNERGYAINVYARCTEQNVRSINRYLNKSLLEILSRNGIKIANLSLKILNSDSSAKDGK